MAAKKYDASAIDVVENLEAVRKRPGMYIGGTNSKGLHHLIKEIIDNSVDEHLAGFCTTIKISLDADNTVTVEDDGRGIPVDLHKKTKRPAVETIFTTLHAGGKFGGNNSGYKISGGLHGVGSSVVNALSEYLIVTIWKDRYEYVIKFNKGGSVITPLKKIGPTTKHGTKVEFKPDEQMFSTTNFNGNEIAEMLKQLSYLNPGLKIIFDDKKNETQCEFHNPDGLVGFVDELSKGQKPLTKTYGFKSENNEIIINVALKWTSAIQENIHSFVNNIITPDGGSHESAFKYALTRALNEFISDNKLTQGGKPLDGPDTREGLYVIISIYLVEEHLQFEGQTKSKLSSPFARTYAEKEIYEQIKHYLNKNAQEAKLIIEKAYVSKRAKEAAKRAREVTRELGKTKTKSFAGKLVTAQTKIAKDRELFIVEGDSAGGSAKLGRDRKTQAILPLKGKIINTERANLKNILANDELATTIHAIGAGLSDKFNARQSNYGKIIIMTDADTDGAHIQALLLTFFYRFMKELVDAGMIYIAMPPLFKITNKSNKKSQYAWTNVELDKIKKLTPNIEVQRYKGLGEMNYEQLWETTMDPKARTLVQVKDEDAEAANRIIETLMGQDASVRREWIEENVEFSLDDDFEINGGVKND